jgi:hypothetical protein
MGFNKLWREIGLAKVYMIHDVFVFCLEKSGYVSFALSEIVDADHKNDT